MSDSIIDDDDDDDDDGDYSGLYCEHWNEPGTCVEMCKCGHKCHDHQGSKCLKCSCGGFDGEPDERSEP